MLILCLPIPPHGGQLDGDSHRGLRGYITDARRGLSFAASDRFVSRLLLVQALAALATGATGAMLVVLAEEHLRLSPSGFAWLIGAIGVGALVGPLIPNTLARDYRDARWLFAPYVIRGVVDLLLATSTSPSAALFLLFVYGLNTSTGIVPSMQPYRTLSRIG